MIRRASNPQRIIPPSIEPITLKEAKDYLRLVDSGQDDQITVLIQAAREIAESYTGRAFVSQTFRATFDKISACDVIELPNPRLIEVSEIKVFNEDDEETVVSSSLYRVDTRTEPGRIIIKDDFDEDQRDYSAVEITYTAGYGESANDVPMGIKSAIKLIVYHSYINRDSTLTGSIVAKMPYNHEWLLNQFRMYYL